jgi:hypothetical protein
MARSILPEETVERLLDDQRWACVTQGSLTSVGSTSRPYLASSISRLNGLRRITHRSRMTCPAALWQVLGRVYQRRC